MTFRFDERAKQRLFSDFNKKYLSSGLRISGDLQNDKLTLYLIDDYGKHSAFMNEYFYGKTAGNRASGNFRVSNYALILLIVLFAFVVESVISAFVFGKIEGIAVPFVIGAAEVLYFFWLRRNSKAHNRLIANYLERLCDGDEIESAE